MVATEPLLTNGGRQSVSIEAARNLKAGRAAADAYAKPTKFAGSSSADMGF